jgi:hypothetical protein
MLFILKDCVINRLAMQYQNLNANFDVSKQFSTFFTLNILLDFRDHIIISFRSDIFYQKVKASASSINNHQIFIMFLNLFWHSS